MTVTAIRTDSRSMHLGEIHFKDSSGEFHPKKPPISTGFLWIFPFPPSILGIPWDSMGFPISGNPWKPTTISAHQAPAGLPRHPSLERLPLGFGESLRQDSMPKFLIQTSLGTVPWIIGSSDHPSKNNKKIWPSSNSSSTVDQQFFNSSSCEFCSGPMSWCFCLSACIHWWVLAESFTVMEFQLSDHGCTVWGAGVSKADGVLRCFHRNDLVLMGKPNTKQPGHIQFGNSYIQLYINHWPKKSSILTLPRNIHPPRAPGLVPKALGGWTPKQVCTFQKTTAAHFAASSLPRVDHMIIPWQCPNINHHKSPCKSPLESPKNTGAIPQPFPKNLQFPSSIFFRKNKHQTSSITIQLWGYPLVPCPDTSLRPSSHGHVGRCRLRQNAWRLRQKLKRATFLVTNCHQSIINPWISGQITKNSRCLEKWRNWYPQISSHSSYRRLFRGGHKRLTAPAPPVPVCHAAHQTPNVCHRSPPLRIRTKAWHRKKHSWVSFRLPCARCYPLVMTNSSPWYRWP